MAFRRHDEVHPRSGRDDDGPAILPSDQSREVPKTLLVSADSNNRSLEGHTAIVGHRHRPGLGFAREWDILQAVIATDLSGLHHDPAHDEQRLDSIWGAELDGIDARAHIRGRELSTHHLEFPAGRTALEFASLSVGAHEDDADWRP